MNEKTKNIYILKRVPGIGPKAIQKILNAGYDSIHQLASECNEDEIRNYTNRKTAIETITANTQQHSEKIEREIESLYNKGIKLYSMWDDQYPKGYSLIEEPPMFIYTKGNSELLNWEDSIAIIGTRDCSQIGYEIASRTAKYFAESGFNIVSGLAKGIDTAGHRGALEAEGGKTTAVLVDIENIYPTENKDLSNQILENDGLLIAENPPGAPPAGNLFVRRDRLQSGLSLAVFPIETDIKGGTMHTVRFSEEQKRLRFVPDLKNVKEYRINENRAKGIIELITSGRAKVFTKSSYDSAIEQMNMKKMELYHSKDFKKDTAPEQQSIFDQ